MTTFYNEANLFAAQLRIATLERENADLKKRLVGNPGTLTPAELHGWILTGVAILAGAKNAQLAVQAALSQHVGADNTPQNNAAIIRQIIDAAQNPPLPTLEELLAEVRDTLTATALPDRSCECPCPLPVGSGSKAYCDRCGGDLC